MSGLVASPSIGQSHGSVEDQSLGQDPHLGRTEGPIDITSCTDIHCPQRMDPK